VEFDEDSFALAGIIKLAEALTEDSFAKFDKLVVRSPLPDGQGIVERTPGSDLKKVFSILGVEEYLEIQERPTQRQQEAAKKKKPPAK
jgi:hypothetical protein